MENEMTNMLEGKCPCCSSLVKVKIVPAKWIGQKDKVIIKRDIWAENWK